MKKISKEKLHLPKIEGITLRWLINIIGVIVVFFIIVFIISAFAIKNTYYSNVESILNSGASSTAVSYFSANLDVGNTLEQSATEYIDSYSYKEKTTTWIIDNDGKVVVSSSGFAIEKQEMPDYEEALASDSNKSKYIGKISNGEKVMAVCRIIKDSNGDNVGAIRVLSSLEQIDRQVATLTFLVFIGLVIVFALIIFSNLFFIRSIIFPVQEITETTKKISQGDYSVRIEKKYDDEIGNLCDSINTMAEEIDINKLKKSMLEEDTIIDIAELFKVFADSTRVKIINALLLGKLCVGDIATIINTSQSAVSHQLRILKSAKLVKYTKVGKTVYYELSDEHVKTLFNMGKEHINEI